MVRRNIHFAKLTEKYLFPEVMRRVKQFKKKYPERDLISLSIGDTSEPLPISVTQGLVDQSAKMGTREGYRGYGAEAGEEALRSKIAEIFYNNQISAEEIFISDGAKCDINRLQLLFGSSVSIAIQDPAYPVYADSGVLLGNNPIAFLPCHAENHFFPDIEKIPPVDLLYLCSPNNPTGSVATKQQLKKAIAWAQEKKSFIIFDAAYSGFIQDPSLPRSIYEIEGSEEVAIEVSSFSKFIGFTGVRVGWSVVPKKMLFEDGHPVHKDFHRLVTTIFNGASIISQAGALAALSSDGISDMKQMLLFYLENAKLIKQALEQKGLTVYGGINAPYLWVYFGKYHSWDLFQNLLETTGVIATPGSGFGAGGEGFLRFSAFGSREHIKKAVKRIEKWSEKLS